MCLVCSDELEKVLADLDRYREEQNQLELQQQGSVLYKAHMLKFRKYVWDIRENGNEIGAVLQIGYELVHHQILHFDADCGIYFVHTIPIS
jgi:hypothetical protein